MEIIINRRTVPYFEMTACVEMTEKGKQQQQQQQQHYSYKCRSCIARYQERNIVSYLHVHVEWADTLRAQFFRPAVL